MRARGRGAARKQQQQQQQRAMGRFCERVCTFEGACTRCAEPNTGALEPQCAAACTAACKAMAGCKWRVRLREQEGGW